MIVESRRSRKSAGAASAPASRAGYTADGSRVSSPQAPPEGRHSCRPSPGLRRQECRRSNPQFGSRLRSPHQSWFFRFANTRPRPFAPSTALRAPSPPVGEKDGMRGRPPTLNSHSSQLCFPYGAMQPPSLLQPLGPLAPSACTRNQYFVPLVKPATV